MSAPIQILYIHGGMTFRNKADYLEYLKTKTISLDRKVSWSDEYLRNKLGKDFSIINPRMPLKDNAKYMEWKIFFERHLELLTPPFILIGTSLGGVFLAKYLSENNLSTPALSTYFICPPFDNTLPTEDLVGGFRLKSSLSRIEKNTKRAVFCFSKDDEVVPISHAEKYRAKITNAEMHIFNNKNGHFKVEEFPEIVTMLKEDRRALSHLR